MHAWAIYSAPGLAECAAPIEVPGASVQAKERRSSVVNVCTIHLGMMYPAGQAVRVALTSRCHGNAGPHQATDGRKANSWKVLWRQSLWQSFNRYVLILSLKWPKLISSTFCAAHKNQSLGISQLYTSAAQADLRQGVSRLNSWKADYQEAATTD